jgi:hypothetical protein
MPAPPRPKGIFFVTEGSGDLLNLSELLIESRIAPTREYPFVAEILTPTQTTFPPAAWLGLVLFVPGDVK